MKFEIITKAAFASSIIAANLTTTHATPSSYFTGVSKRGELSKRYLNLEKKIQKNKQEFSNGLPRLFHNEKNCKFKVITPDNKFDNSYHLSEDCKTIFVLPPAFGKVKLENYAISQNTKMLCEVSKISTELVTEMTKSARTNNLKIQELNQTDISDRDENFKERRKNLYLLQKDIANFVVEVIDANNSYMKDVAMTATVSYTTEWSKLLKQYESLNSKNGFKVTRMPILKSIINYTSKIPDDLQVILEGKTILDPVISAHIPGISHMEDGDEEAGELFLNGSIAGQLKLNANGACPLIEGGSYTRAEARSIAPYMNANMTYFYPLQLSAGYKIDFAVEELTKLIKKRITVNGKITSSGIMNDVISSNSNQYVKVTFYDNENGHSIPEKELEDIKQEIIESFILKILDKFAKLSGSVPEMIELKDPTDPTRDQKMRRTICTTKRRLFSKKRTCRSHNYIIKIKVDAIKETLQKFKTTLTGTSTYEYKKFTTYVKKGTLTFIEDEEK